MAILQNNSVAWTVPVVPPLVRSAIAQRKATNTITGSPNEPGVNTASSTLQTSTPQPVNWDRGPESRPAKRKRDHGIGKQISGHRKSSHAPGRTSTTHVEEGIGASPTVIDSGNQVACPDSRNSEDPFVDERESDGTESEIDTTPLTLPATQLSSFVPSKHNILSECETEWTVRLVGYQTLTMIGQYDLWVRKGAINVLGAVLHPSSQLHRVFAASTHSLPTIRRSHNPYGPTHQPAEITLFHIQSGIRLLRQLTPRYCGIWNHRHTQSIQLSQSPAFQRSFSFLASSADDPLKRPLSIVEPPGAWQLLINKLVVEHGLRCKAVMISGPKSSGKSTFARLFSNALLTKSHASHMNHTMGDGVAFMDLDVGQPEFSSPGDISLIHLRSCNLGPPFTHPIIHYATNATSQRCIKSHHLGANTPRDDPQHYLNCALDLLRQYQALLLEFPSCPMIVNCSGWLFGSGLETHQELVRSLELTDVVYLNTQEQHQVLDGFRDATDRMRIPLHVVPSQPVDYTTRTAADLRMMQVLSYFHSDQPEGGQLRWDATTLKDMTPLSLRYAGPGQDIFGIVTMSEQQDPALLYDLLDGSLVGVVMVEDESALRQHAATTGFASDTSCAWYPVGQAKVSPTENLECSKDCGDDNSKYDTDPAKDPHLAANRATAARKDPTQDPPCFDLTRTAEGLPYLFHGTGFYTPLDPSKTRSLGQAIVRGIDIESKTVHLVTPMPHQSILDQCKKKKIVLVRGKLEMPTWAYQEECAVALSIAKKTGQKTAYGPDDDGYNVNDVGSFDMRGWADGKPWVRVVSGDAERQRRDRIWRIRRNLTTSSRSGAHNSD